MGLPCVCGEPHESISTTLLESTEEVVDAKTSVDSSNNLCLVLPVGVLVVSRLPGSCQPLEADF